MNFQLFIGIASCYVYFSSNIPALLGVKMMKAHVKKKREKAVELLSNSFNEDDEFCTARVHLRSILTEHAEFTGLFSLFKIFWLVKTCAAQAASKAPVLVIDWHWQVQDAIWGFSLNLSLLRFWHLNRLLIWINNKKRCNSEIQKIIFQELSFEKIWRGSSFFHTYYPELL